MIPLTTCFTVWLLHVALSIPLFDLYPSVQRVRKTALSLARSLPHKNPDILVVDLAALLHDVLDKKYVSAAEAADPYGYFLPFFQSLVKDYALDLLSDGRAALIVKIVENVSWTTEKKLRESGKLEEWHVTCIELHCVQDADRLDAIGAFGGSQAFQNLWRTPAWMIYHRDHAMCSIQRGSEPVSLTNCVVTCLSLKVSDLCTPLRVVMIPPFNTFMINSSTYKIGSRRSPEK